MQPIETRPRTLHRRGRSRAAWLSQTAGSQESSGLLVESDRVNIKNKSHAITAEVIVPEGGAQGVIIAQGGAFAGWSLYAKDGRPTYCYNLLGLQRFKIEGDAPIPSGEHQVRMAFAYDGGN